MTPNNSGASFGRMGADPTEPPLDPAELHKPEVPDSIINWVAWASGCLLAHERELADVRGRLGFALQQVSEAEAKRKEYEEALEGMRKAERLRKSVYVYEPGTEVLIGPEESGRWKAVVEHAIIDRAGLGYLVKYWANGSLHHIHLHSTEVFDTDLPLTIPRTIVQRPPATEPSDEQARF